MSSSDIEEPIKSTSWLGFEIYSIPLNVFTTPPVNGSVKDSLKFAFLKDEFEIFVIKTTDSVLNVAVFRNRQNPDETPDDGYALRFHFTIIGFDEEPQTAIMRHDGDRSNPLVAFRLTENILSKVNTTHHIFELFVVIHMLEFRSLDENDENKKAVDDYMSVLKSKLTSPELLVLSYILKSPGLEDTFTGRLPITYLSTSMLVLAMVKPIFPRIVTYLSVREMRNPSDPNLNLGNILEYIGLANEDGPAPPEEATDQYIIAHKMGLEFYKTILSDYMVSILDHDYDVLDVLEASLMVHDEELFRKAIISFLNRFHEITRSQKFKDFTRFKGFVTRLIIHSARIWVANNDVYIPSWVLTTEL